MEELKIMQEEEFPERNWYMEGREYTLMFIKELNNVVDNDTVRKHFCTLYEKPFESDIAATDETVYKTYLNAVIQSFGVE